MSALGFNNGSWNNSKKHYHNHDNELTSLHVVLDDTGEPGAGTSLAATTQQNEDKLYRVRFYVMAI